MSAFSRRIERLLMSVTSRPWLQRRHGRLVLERVAGCDLLILPGVMNPRIFRSGAYFARAVQGGLIEPESQVLDMGAGSGIVGIVAARAGANVVAIDINPAAVRCTRINAMLNTVEDRVDARQGDLFEPVQGQCFEHILFNPPYFRGAPQPGFEQSWRSVDAVERFAADLGRHLAPGGSALLALSTHGDVAGFQRAFNKNGYEHTIVSSRRLLAETFLVFRFRPRCTE
jgi:HemK-related putative methylase